MLIILVDELARYGSDLAQILRMRADKVLAHNSASSALHWLRLFKQGGSSIPEIDGIILRLEESDFSGRKYENAIHRFAEYFRSINRELPPLVLICAGDISKELLRLVEEIGDSVIVKPCRLGAVQANTQNDLVEQLLTPEFYLVHT